MKKNQIYLFISIVIFFASACNKPEKEYVAPKIWTMLSFDITTTEATFRANFTKGSEDITVFGFEWKETMEEDWRIAHAQANNGSFSLVMTNLKEDVEYRVKAFIVDAFDNKYFGEERRFSTNGTVTDIDGNVYLTLRYGSKVWMTENLRVTRYADGTPIEGRSGGCTLDSDGPVYFYSAYHTSYFRVPNFGLLYNWAAFMRAEDCESDVSTSPFGHTQGVCPDGWHIPSASEWRELIGHSEGSVKTTTWSENAAYTANVSRFSVEPSGGYYYFDDKGFRGVFNAAYFWTDAQGVLPFVAYCRALVSGDSQFHTLLASKSAGYSVRCVKDHQDW